MRLKCNELFSLHRSGFIASKNCQAWASASKRCFTHLHAYYTISELIPKLADEITITNLSGIVT